MGKKTANPLASIEVGTKNIYYDKDHEVWKVRVMHQNEPGNVRSPKKWRDIDLHQDRARLEAKHPTAEVIQ